jgi:hypothetical protein
LYLKSDIVKSLIKGVNSVLSVREQIGAIKEPVSIVTRTWTGKAIGDGDFTDTEELINPQPGIKDLSHNLRLSEGGAIKQGDLIINCISKKTYPTEDLINGKSEWPTIEKFYKVGDSLYNVISVVQKYLTWNVQIRRHLAQVRK